MITFSIVTVCYNSEKTIERTIRSVLAQEFKDYEYLIVDGGSEDNTLDIVKRIEPLFEGRLKWESSPDKGIYDAFNKGVKWAKGKYVWLVNSDDFIEPNALKILYSYISQYKGIELPIISGSQNSWSEERQTVYYVERKNARRGKRCYYLDLTGFTHPATLIPKSVYETIGLYDDRFIINGDCDFFHRSYKAGVPYLYINEVLTNMSDGGISGNWNLKRLQLTLKDGVVYFNKNYFGIKRYIKLSIWTLLMIRLYIKKNIK